MTFIVSRTSGSFVGWVRGGLPPKPCNEAYRSEIINYNGELSSAWCVKINSLDELKDFYNKYGEIVITKNSEYPSYIELEIYDDYRE